MRRTGLLEALALLGLMLLLVAAMAAKSALVSVPELPASVDPENFDAIHARARLARVLGDQRPHPVDSEGQDGVRARLVAELRGLGLQPVVSDSTTCNSSGRDRTISCARIRNVVATIGPARGRHLLFVSHYDSTPVGPGASDDGIGIASMLEVAALLKDRPLKRPVSFLFDEGEEAGLLGARAFLERDPLAAKVDTAINLESRGVNGPAIMFETSLPNGAAVAAFKRALDRPVANSLTTGFYHLIPNSTDVAVLDERPWTLLNFAIIGNETRYHSTGDTLDALDVRSLGHMGRQALALGRTLAESDTPAVRPGPRLYADLLQRGFVAIPQWAGIVLLAGLLLGYGAMAWRRGRAVGRGAAAVGLALVGSALAAFVLQALVGLARPGEFWRAHPEPLSLAVDVTALAVSVALLGRLAGGTSRARLRLAFWLCFLVLGAAIGFIVPGAILYFLAPPLIVGLGLALRRREKTAALLAWAVLFLSWAPLLYLSEVLLDLDAAWIFAPVSALLVLPPLIELQGPMARIAPRLRLAGAAAVAALAWGAAALTPAYSLERPQRLSLEYEWDTQTAKARWLVYHEGGPIPPSIAALGRFEHGVVPPWSPYKRWAAPARGPAVDPPRVDKIGEMRGGGGSRVIALRLRARGSEVIRLRFPAESGLEGVEAGGSLRRFGPGKDAYVIRCHGRSCDGLVLRLALPLRPVEATIIGMRSGLPAEAAETLAGRPATARPQYSADATYVVSKLRL